MFITKTIKQAKKKVFVNFKLGPYFYIVLTINKGFCIMNF